MDLLIVDKNPAIASGLRRALVQHGHRAACVKAADVLSTPNRRCSVLLLDWRLPDAPEFVSTLRQAGRMVPVLALGQDSRTETLVEALEAGADDFVAKTAASVEELVARAAALNRRATMRPRPRRIDASGIVVDQAGLSVTAAGKSVHISGGDLRVLSALAASVGQLLTKEELITAGWGEGAEVSMNTLESVVKRIRRTLGREARRIRCVRSAGYVLENPTT